MAPIGNKNASGKRSFKTKNKIRQAHSIPVVQYSLSGMYLTLWPSAKDASVDLGINYGNIAACLTGRRNSAGGFK